MLMLSSPDAARLFAGLRAVIVDEVHSFAASKRGDFTALALSRLSRAFAASMCAPGFPPRSPIRPRSPHGLARRARPPACCNPGLPSKPDIRMLEPDNASIPYGGYMARYAVPAIYEAIRAAGTSIVFVNTRAQAELMLQMLWDANEDNLPIAIYHGSLDRELRRRTEAMMAAGKIRSVVATAALELGIDWGDVDLVIQVAAPKGVSRLLQRVGPLEPPAGCAEPRVSRARESLRGAGMPAALTAIEAGPA